MALELETVRKVATLARLQFSQDELQTLRNELNQILHHMEQLEQIDTSHVEPLSHATDIADHMRDDECKPSLPREHALANAPQSDNEFFLVPPVFKSPST